MDAKIIRLRMNYSILKEQRDDYFFHMLNCKYRHDERCARYWSKLYDEAQDAMSVVYKELLKFYVR